MNTTRPKNPAPLGALTGLFRSSGVSILLRALALISGAGVVAQAADYLWQEEHATVLPTGDIEWKPRPFEFRTSGTVYYIDFETGSDTNDGQSTASPWKHHPWDANATGNAKNASGAHTYIFKRGVTYRGQLMADESGLPGQPIRLTSDPSWGSGPARLTNSTRLTGMWVRADDPSVTPPARLTGLDQVWALNLTGASWLDANGNITARTPDGVITWINSGILPTPDVGLFLVDENDVGTRQHLARTPDWQPMSENFAMEYWHITDKQVATYYPEINQTVGGPTDADLIGLPQDWFTGGTSWFMYQDLMGTPVARDIPATRNFSGVHIPFFNPVTGTFLQGLPYGLDAGGRYFIENLPQYLDAAGEYYLDKPAKTLYYRPAEGVDPNTLRLELTIGRDLLWITNRSHLDISGLTFEFIGFDAMAVSGHMENVAIHHNTFRHITKRGIYTKQRITNVVSQGPKDDIFSHYEVSDNYFEEIWANAISIEDGHGYSLLYPYGRLHDVRVLRNRTYYTGERANTTIQSAVEAIRVSGLRDGHVAGNIVERSFGSGLLVFGGSTSGLSVPDFPYNRILVYQNKTQDTALGVNDYGGLSLWMGGPIFSFNNNIGNATGHMPAGFRGSGGPRNLSYPYYIDGGYKQYGFNNIIWGRTTDLADPYRSTEAAYFNVFGFLNQFCNNTVYRHRWGIGGSTGHRNDHVGNIFAEISDRFLNADRSGNPSLIGGGDDGTSALRGVPTLGFGHNAFEGTAEAGVLIEAADYGGEREIISSSIETMAQQMADFPIRYAQLGERSAVAAVFGADFDPMEDTSEADFRHTASPQVLDAAGSYFVPWGLWGVVGEWNFTENHADPTQIIDFSFYLSEAHFGRMMFEFIPYFTLKLNEATLADYVPAFNEDWTNGAIRFDGTTYATYPDAKMREEIAVPLEGHSDWVNEASKNPNWVPDAPTGSGGAYSANDFIRFPGHLRKTPAIARENILVEATLKVVPGTNGDILGKHDGASGYRLFLNSEGRAQFQVSAGGAHYSVATSQAINNGQWHHVLAELQRAGPGQSNGRLTIYLDGAIDQEVTGLSLSSDHSTDNAADLVVGAHNPGSGFTNHLQADLDFLRLAHHTLAEADTTIAELWAWQTNGPWKRDMRGNLPLNKRDAGALEAVEPIAPSSLPLTRYFDGTVRLHWQDNSSVETAYRIERSTSADFSTDLTVFTVPAGSRTFLDNTINLHQGTYFYRFFTVMGGEFSLPSAVLSTRGVTVLGFNPSGMILNGAPNKSGEVLADFISGGLASHGPGLSTTNGWANTISSAGFDGNTEAAVVAANDYLSFTILPAAGQSIKIEGVTIDLWTQNNNVGVFFLRSPLSGATNLGSWAYPDNQQVTVDLGTRPEFNVVSAPVEFRLYFHHTNSPYGARGIFNRGEDRYALAIQASPLSPLPKRPDSIKVAPRSGQLDMTFPTAVGTRYRLQWAASPEGPYAPVQPAQEAEGNDADATFTVPLPASGAIFYRVEYVQ